MKPLNTALIRLTLLLLAGIITGFYLQIPLLILFPVMGFFILLFFVAYWRAKKLLFKDSYFGITVILLFFFLGIFITQIHNPENRPLHYLNNPSITASENIYKLEITEVLKPDDFNRKYVASTISLNGEAAEGKILLLQSLASGDSLKIGTIFHTFGELENIPAPLNPHQFNYRKYMNRKGIFKQLRVDQQYTVIENYKWSLQEIAATWRDEISKSLSHNGLEKEELSIVQALILGQKKDISPEVYKDFAAAGTVHILAISGLHVGIILLIFNWLFSPLRKFSWGKITAAVLIILLLWLFAVLAGLSASVVRAVTMFSFIAVGLQLKRRSSTLNSIFLSLLVLLIIRPSWIFDVGFQLSYAAVIAIVLIQPRLSELWKPRYRPASYFWQLLTTTVAAQLGVLPLSLYYFHQFPGLFFLSNLLILPFLGVLLAGGIGIIMLSLFDLLPAVIIIIYSRLIELLSQVVTGIANQKEFIISDISFNFSRMLLVYLIILLGIILLYNFRYRPLRNFLISLALLQIYSIYGAAGDQQKLIVFNSYGKSIIGSQKGEKLTLFSNTDIAGLPMIHNYKVGEKIDSIMLRPFQNLYFHNDQLLLVIDSTTITPSQKFQPDYLLLTGDPKVNLERLLDIYHPKMILADGDNFSTSKKRWAATCALKKVPFYSTRESGAFQIR